MPIADWRFDFSDRRKIARLFEGIGDVDSVRSNDGGTRSFKCIMPEAVDYDVNIYLWPDCVEVRWFNDHGSEFRSERILVSENPVDSTKLAEKVKETVRKLAQEREATGE